ncbi:hypothetical protein Fcan01_08284 [Folsomia candida]|uniref:Uncharacterized protein n=1 Tax=Folsomia candida TaxID=158441 RepID=A0A226EHA3_FOLCA|nr:hypothetical protein Fcan01_08284 [Folsomia candida]
MEDSLETLPGEISIDGENDPFAEVPLWSMWVSTMALSIAFVIGLPLWSSSSLAGLTGLATLQQVVGNLSNVCSTFLTVSIAILRYRRLCWKKKDKFSASNAIKWSVLIGCVALAAFTFSQTYSSFHSNDEKTMLIFTLVKILLIILSMAIVLFCYIRISQRVWANVASQEKVMDHIKQKNIWRKSRRNLAARAAIHSCVQIILVIATLSPHLYEQMLEALCSQSLLEIAAAQSSKSVVGSTSISGGDVQGYHDDFNVMMGDSGGSGSGDEDWLRSPQSPEAAIQEDSSTSSTTLSSSDNHLARLIGITINYALLILGTPMAYIASCHRFREQFTSILFSHVMHSPQNSACNNPNNSPKHHHHHHQSKNQLSSCSGFRACRSHAQSQSPGHTIYSCGRPYSSTTTTRTKTAPVGSFSGLTARNSISVSANNTSTTVTISRSNGSTKSRGSIKRSSSTKRKGSRGLLGSEFIIVDSDSTAMLHDQELSNSTNPKGTPTPSPTMTDNANGSNEERKGSIFCTNLQTAFVATSIENMGRKNSLQTILQNYGYDFSDLGELV